MQLFFENTVTIWIPLFICYYFYILAIKKYLVNNFKLDIVMKKILDH